jgi:ABC-type Mn2+/Zn2+ transport system permease subunit
VIVIGGFILGAVIGALTAKQRGGKPADMAQYAAGFGIAFCLLGLFLTIFLERMLLR